MVAHQDAREHRDTAEAKAGEDGTIPDHKDQQSMVSSVDGDLTLKGVASHGENVMPSGIPGNMEKIANAEQVYDRQGGDWIGPLKGTYEKELLNGLNTYLLVLVWSDT